MGLGVTIFLTAEGIVFWLLGGLAKKYTADLRPILWVFTLAYLVFARELLRLLLCRAGHCRDSDCGMPTVRHLHGEDAG